jgi:hypothetical protein
MSLGKFKLRKFVFGQLQKFWAIREWNNIYNLKPFGKQILLRKTMKNQDEESKKTSWKIINDWNKSEKKITCHPLNLFSCQRIFVKKKYFVW